MHHHDAEIIPKDLRRTYAHHEMLSDAASRTICQLVRRVGRLEAGNREIEMDAKKALWTRLREAGMREAATPVEDDDCEYTIHDLRCVASNAVFAVANAMADELPSEFTKVQAVNARLSLVQHG